MTDEVQNQVPPQASGAPEVAESAPTTAPPTGDPVPAVVATPAQADTPPQPDTPAAPDADAQAEPQENASRTIVTDVLDNPIDATAAFDAVAGVEHAHSMVSNWLQRVEAGLHVPLDELRALKERLANWL